MECQDGTPQKKGWRIRTEVYLSKEDVFIFVCEEKERQRERVHRQARMTNGLLLGHT